MATPNIGVNGYDFRTDPRSGLQKAARMGLRTVELRTLEGDVDPANLSASGRRHLGRIVRDLGLRLVALDADFGTGGLAHPGRVDACVHKSIEVLTLARELGVPVVVGSVGRLDDSEDPRAEPVFGALKAIGEQADTIGCVYAVNTTFASPRALRGLLDELDCPAIRICTDPGALVMAGYDPVAATELLADRVALSHARDGLVGGSERAGREVPLGHGHVNWLQYLATLSAADYAGPQILRRTDSQRPADDLAEAREVLESQMGL